MDLGISGRVALVTGASSGIGLATARALASEGASVLLAARRADPLEDAARAVREVAHDAEVATEALDVTAEDAGERLAAAAQERLGGLDIAVNNAGTSAARGLLDQPDAEWQAQWELNVMAPLRVMRAVARPDGRARLGEGRQRLLLGGQASLAAQPGLRGHERRRAVAVAAVRRRVRGTGSW